MAQKQNTINNKRGQAMIEATGMMIIAGAFLFLLLRSLMGVITAVSVEALAEDYFICELEQQPQCLLKLKLRLSDIQLRDIHITTKETGQTMTVTISTTHLSQFKIAREFNYEKFRQQF